ncbi:uncharacterized protein LOC100679906 isoform X2 [Nasonia vitripennis]|uniref:Uncharacterized protein n=1 Tax=Nasonia vitripennis TaxID=7425 RepID=A0A7M7M1L4_NASVI|nr:uncharacterized protein LOC100679906 isoform X2 [Nasonia vitripennis]
MQSALRKLKLHPFLFFAIAAAILRGSTALFDMSQDDDEYYLANATLILIESPNSVYFDIGSELPMPVIHYKLIDDPDYTDDLFTFGYIRNSSNTDTIDVLRAASSYSNSLNYIMSRPTSSYDSDLLYVALQYLLPNTFFHEDAAVFPQGGTYLISKGFINLLTVDEAVPCDQPWYFHAYVTRDGANNDYDVLLRAIYQMDMNPVYYCSSKG